MDIDDELRLEVIGELKRERRISNPDHIQVAVKERIVTLSGCVEHYMDQIAAVEAAECVPGVEGVVQELQVNLPEESKRGDEEIVRAACTAIEHNSTIPARAVKVSVSDGWVTLEGKVSEEHQKEEAANTVARILGVRGITNNIAVKSQVKPYDVTLRIEQAFRHLATHHARGIYVEIVDGKVVLSGLVRAWVERAEAEAAALEVPGVKEVENRLEITPLLEGKETPPAGVIAK